MWFIVLEVEQETSAPPPKKNPGSSPDLGCTEGESSQFSYYMTLIVPARLTSIVEQVIKIKISLSC